MGRISVGAIVERRILCIIVQLRVEWGGLAASGVAPPQAGKIGMLGHECGLAARVKRGVWTSHDRPVMVAREHLGCQPHVRLDVFVAGVRRYVEGCDMCSDGGRRCTYIVRAGGRCRE